MSGVGSTSDPRRGRPLRRAAYREYRRGRITPTTPTCLPTSTTWPRRRPSTTPRASSSPTPWDTIEARIKGEVTYNGELTTPEPHITKSGGGSGNQSVPICLSVCRTESLIGLLILGFMSMDDVDGTLKTVVAPSSVHR